VVTLLGAVTGGAIAGRSQRTHWRRDKQIEACTAIVSESTRTQIALRREWRRNEKVDWIPWNEALAMISLVGTPNTIHSAEDMDAAFWSSTSHMEEVGTIDETTWAEIVRILESKRLDFINVARREVVGLNNRLNRLPISRPTWHLGADAGSPDRRENSA
jgi:ribosomal protein L39E